MKQELRQAFRAAFKSSDMTVREFRTKAKQDAAYLMNDSRVSSDKLVAGLAALGLSVDVRVYEAESIDRGQWQPVDTTGWEI